MMIGKVAFAAGLFVASSLGGVALGSYTIGGFRMDQPAPDIIRDLAAADVSDEAPPQQVAVIGPVDTRHVCKGCDAKLYRDREWRYEEPAYEDASYEGYSEPEDLMPWEDELPRAAEAVHDKPPVAAVEAAAPVVTAEAAAPVSLAAF